MSKQKNNISNKIQSDKINDDTNFEDTEKDNDAIDEENPILNQKFSKKLISLKIAFVNSKYQITTKKFGIISFVLFLQKKLEL